MDIVRQNKICHKHKSDILRNVEGKQKDDKIRQTEAGEGTTTERVKRTAWKLLTHTGVTTGTLRRLGCGEWRETS